jgi:hypothetical protein
MPMTRHVPNGGKIFHTGVAKKMKTVAKSANLLVKKNCIICLLEPKVFRNEHVLKDALTLIRRMDSMKPGPNLRVTGF